jgi:hypothetical protein
MLGVALLANGRAARARFAARPSEVSSSEGSAR